MVRSRHARQPIPGAPLAHLPRIGCIPDDARHVHGLIKTCFETVLRLSNAITDPIERAFFLLTHLLYLLPFDQCNATMALLTMNAPLIAAGLRPMTFAGVQPGDLLAGIRAVWELNRTEMLRDTFAVAG